MKCLLPLLLAPLALFAATPPEFKGSIERLDPALDTIIPPGAKIEKLCGGFHLVGGTDVVSGLASLFRCAGKRDLPMEAGRDEGRSFIKPSGMLSPRQGFREQGSNGLGVDAQGRLLICQHGERRLARLEMDGTQTALADTV